MNSRILLIACLWTASGLGDEARVDWPLNGAPVCTENHSQRSIRVASDGAAGAIVVWSDDRNGSSDILAQRIDSTGATRWTAQGVGVCLAASEQSNPAVTCSAYGCVVFWNDFRNGTSDIYAQRLLVSGAAQWAANGIPLATGASQQVNPLAINDDASPVSHGDPPVGFIAVWNATTTGGYQYRMQHVDISAGSLWSTPGTGGVAMTPVSTLIGSALATDGIGVGRGPRGAVLVWKAGNTVGNVAVLARRIDYNGTPQWSTSGVLLAASSGTLGDPEVAYVGGGNVIAVWDHNASNSTSDIQAQKLDSGGNALWTAAGVPVCATAAYESSPRITTDLTGGAIVAWMEGSPLTGGVIRVQRLDANGQRLWDPQGVAVCTSPGNQFDPRVVGDGSGGVIVAWVDDRLGTDDIYVQRIGANGNRLWAPTGVPLCSAENAQGSVALTTDGRFGAIAAWADRRTGTNDVYANRVYANNTVDVAPLLSRELRLVMLSSNPGHGDLRLALELPRECSVTLDVIDVSGRHVRSLGSSMGLDAGSHSIHWDGTSDSGAAVKAGVYFVRALAGEASVTTRAVRLE